MFRLLRRWKRVRYGLIVKYTNGAIATYKFNTHRQRAAYTISNDDPTVLWMVPVSERVIDAYRSQA